MVHLHAKALPCESGGQVLQRRQERRHARVLAGDRDQHHLRGGDGRREDQAAVVAVHHGHHPDGARCQTPAVLPWHLTHALLILELDTENVTKFLSQLVRRCPLHRTAGEGDEGLDREAGFRPSELLGRSLGSRHHGHGQKVFIDCSIQFLHLESLGCCSSLRCVCCVAFLPQELACAQERSGILEFPSYNITPLIDSQWQISMRPWHRVR
mmetsp:Transcript_72620/g.194075  ORF Transcript_72620/g.194075 Transcript_72620/m.194075 type:complete len:211 (+) Transcript_72620:111-743(+)